MNYPQISIDRSPSAEEQAALRVDADPSPVPGKTVWVWVSETERAKTRIKSIHVNAFDTVCFVHRRLDKPNDEIGHVNEALGILVNGKPTQIGGA